MKRNKNVLIYKNKTKIEERKDNTNLETGDVKA